MDYLKLLGSAFQHFKTLFGFIFPLKLCLRSNFFFFFRSTSFQFQLTFLVVHSCFVIRTGLLFFHHNRNDSFADYIFSFRTLGSFSPSSGIIADQRGQAAPNSNRQAWTILKKGKNVSGSNAIGNRPTPSRIPGKKMHKRWS